MFFSVCSSLGRGLKFPMISFEFQYFISDNSTAPPTKPPSTTYSSQLNTTQLSTTESAIMKQLVEIRSNMKDFDGRIKKLVDWENYREHREKLLSFVKVPHAKDKVTKKYSMFHPHVLVDKVNLDCTKHYKVIVLVTSFAKHFERRQWIRKAWGNQTFWNKTTENWQVIFNVGAVDTEVKETLKSLKKESQKYGDMLILDIPESFHKLSQKVMAALFWVYTKFSFEFIFKTDDDVFIHIRRLLVKLNTTWASEHFIGHAMRGQPPERNKGRYGVSLEEWPRKYYDPYCSGGGYVLSHYIIEHMIPHFNWETPLKIDDAYIGHLVKLAGGKVYHDHKSFLMWNNWLEYLPNLVVTHPLKFPDFREFVEAKVGLEVGRLKTHEVQNFSNLKDYNNYKKREKALLKTTRRLLLASTVEKNFETTPSKSTKIDLIFRGTRKRLLTSTVKKILKTTPSKSTKASTLYKTASMVEKSLETTLPTSTKNTTFSPVTKHP